MSKVATTTPHDAAFHLAVTIVVTHTVPSPIPCQRAMSWVNHALDELWPCSTSQSFYRCHLTHLNHQLQKSKKTCKFTNQTNLLQAASINKYRMLASAPPQLIHQMLTVFAFLQSSIGPPLCLSSIFDRLDHSLFMVNKPNHMPTNQSNPTAKIETTSGNHNQQPEAAQTNVT